MIYKHAISTITPTKAFSRPEKDNNAPAEEETAEE